MKKIILIILLIFLALLNTVAFSKPKKVKCKKPIYFFENVKKDDYFTYLDGAVQQHGYSIKKFYPNLGFISVDYKISGKHTDPTNLLLKQFGNDVYFFIDIKNGNTKLEKDLYGELKKHSKNSYLMRDDLFCKDLTKDAYMINTRRKVYIEENFYNPQVYVIHMKRYVGYDKKTYFLQKYKNWKKKRNQRKQYKKDAKRELKSLENL